MKPLLLFVTLAASLAAQDNKITVPLSSPGQPATIKISMINGSVSVKAGSGPQVTISGLTESTRRRGRDDNPPPGMHRIDMGSPATGVTEDHNVVTVRPPYGASGHFDIEAPANSSVSIRIVSCGGTEVSGLSGDVDIECTNGSIKVEAASGAVVAHTVNGSITTSIDKAPADKPMSFSSLNGKIDVTLPADTKATVRLKSVNGSAYTDFDLKLDQEEPASVAAEKGKGRYKIKTARSLTGSMNGGGPEYLFQTLNGEILIHKK